jgi:hypothetical protein
MTTAQTDERTDQGAREETNEPLNLAKLIPEHFGRYFEFFRPGHNEGVVPPRIKEIARLKIAALNGCDT